MTYTQDSIPDLTDKVAVVTGANGGLGLETARSLSAKGARVVMAVRNQDKAKAAVDDITRTTPDADLEAQALDLGSQTSVKDCAERIRSRHAKIDILVNNAGLMAMPEQRTEDGYEMQFGVNHLGHWTFTAGLMPAILSAPAARVVTVTSTAHHIGRPVDPKNPHLHGRYSDWGAYGHAKLANYHFGLGLQHAFEEAAAPAASLIAHPGLSHSDLQTRTVREGGGGPLGPFFAWLAAHTGMDPAKGAMPQIRAATDPKAQGGEFYGPRFVNNGPAVRLPILRRGNDRAIQTLWRVSEAETGVTMEIN